MIGGLVLACDPGAKPGFCWGASAADATHRSDAVPAPTGGFAEAVFEAQHSASSLFRNGRRVRIARRSQSTLSFTAGRLFERFDAHAKFRILPDDWRALLWPGARRLPKPVVLARLEVLYGDRVPAKTPKGARADVLEAIGIFEAWRTLSQPQKEKFRVE